MVVMVVVMAEVEETFKLDALTMVDDDIRWEWS